MMKKAVLKKMARVAIKTLLYEVGVLTMFEDTPLNEEDVENAVN